jgi:hypothetical protein
LVLGSTCSVSSVGPLLCGQGADLDEVVGEDAVSAPDPGSGQGGQFGAVPAVAAFEVVDPSFASCAPFDLGAERFSMLEFTPELPRV